MVRIFFGFLKFSITCSLVCVLLIEYKMFDSMIQPCNVNIANGNEKSQQINLDIERKLSKLGYSKQKISGLKNAVKVASTETNISPSLLIAIEHTESQGNPHAISPKGYKGLMQTPTATFEFMDVDMLHGARILQQKLQESHGDLITALALYKGGRSQQAYQQAAQCYNLYQKIKNI